MRISYEQLSELRAAIRPMALPLGDPPGVERVELDSPGDAYDAGLAGLAGREVRMSKLRIKVSGCMRSMAGAEAFCAIRSYLPTSAKHGISKLDAAHPSRKRNAMDARSRMTPSPLPI